MPSSSVSAKATYARQVTRLPVPTSARACTGKVHNILRKTREERRKVSFKFVQSAQKSVDVPLGVAKRNAARRGAVESEIFAAEQPRKLGRSMHLVKKGHNKARTWHSGTLLRCALLRRRQHSVSGGPSTKATRKKGARRCFRAECIGAP